MSVQQPSKVQIAKEQLDIAIELFLTRTSLVSALTLSGAAEEMLGQEVKRFGKINAFDNQFESRRSLLEHAYRHSVSRGVLSKKINFARNATKHFNNSIESMIDLDLEFEVVYMLTRATYNFSLLNLPKPESHYKFDAWFADNPR